MIRSLIVLLAFAAATAFEAPAAAQSNEFDCNVDEQQVLIKYSLYFENYRAQNYEAALPDLEWMLACAPGFAGRTEDDRNFRRAVEVHEELGKRATDPAERRAHFDTALELIETAVPTLRDAGVEVDEHAWLIRKGHFLQTHSEIFANRQDEACEAYEQAFEMDAEATDDFFLQVIAFCRAEEAAAAGSSPEQRRQAREFIEETIMPHVENPASRDYIQSQAERLITTPREQFTFLYERYQERGVEGLSDDDVQQLFRINQQAGTEIISEEQSRSLDRALRRIVADLDPSFSILSSLGSSELADGNHDAAIAFFERAMELATEPNQRRDTYYNIAVVKEQQRQYAAAANYLREALAIDGSHGNSLYLMGSLIQNSIRGTDIQSRAAYWCAADWFRRAAAQGVPNANTAASRAMQGGPSREEIFFPGWRPGDTVTARYGWGTCQARVP